MLSYLDIIAMPLFPVQLAQQTAAPLVETAEVHLSGTRFFFTVLAGLVLAFAFQMLLTNFSVALGISVLDTNRSGDVNDTGPPVKTIGIAMGLWTLMSVSLALFGACALALKFSVLATPTQAISLALIIWATYFTALVWISSTTVGSLIGSVVSTATASFQAIFGTAAAALGANAAKTELVSTVEEATAAIRRQVTAEIDGEDLIDSLSGYLASLRSPGLDLSSLRDEFKQVLQEPEIAGLDPEHLRRINRDAFDQMLADRADISPKERQLLADKMDRAWSEVIRGYRKRDRMDELMTYVREATPQNLLSDGLAHQLEQLIRDYREQPEGANWLTRSFNRLAGIVAGRVDLSDFEVGQVSKQIKQAREQVMNQVDQVYRMMDDSAELPTVLETDVENYLLNTQPWQLTRDRINTDFREVLRDPEANLATIAQQIRGLSLMDFRQILESRGLFTQTKIEAIDQQLRAICREITANIETLVELEKQEALSKKSFIYLQTTPKDQLTSHQIQRAFGELITDDEADVEQLRKRYALINRMELMKPLQTREDLSPEEMNRILEVLQDVQTQALANAEGLKASAELRVQRQWHTLQNYLQQTGKPELNPQGIKRDLQTLLDDPEAGLQDLQVRLAHFDRDTLVQLLSQRNEFNEAEIRQILNQVEQNWSQVKHVPEILSAKAQSKYNEATNAIAHYLRSTGKSELNPEGIRQDLRLLLNDPTSGYEAIYARLSRMDRDTLVQLLSQREDMSAADVEQIIDQVQSTLQTLVKAPRRLARRTQRKVESFQSSLEDYLRSTAKAELNPEGIKRDFKALLTDPRWGAERLSNRLAQMDQSTLTALLSQRQDMTKAEATAIVNQMLEVRAQVERQLAQLTERVKSGLNSILDRIRLYLNSLERPELNYDEIQQDVRVLFDDPEAGFEALRDRLSQCDRNTLVAIMSSHDQISEQDAAQLIDQIESTRSKVLQRAERAHVRLQERMEQLKRQATTKVELTRKAASVAAWWLFATAIASGAAASFGATLAL